ncbi:aminodeoxychorismate synthase component I [Curtobacterium sp. MCJR17_055]|uniref:anthranilate synthase component I family protein n=1 Tax=unclassified Curtobacterium TaxID=257496 RepID=UPI000D847EAA|nr:MULTISPECIES: chorismate-binding protein [unclassified Curtobacterium]PYY34596.1 aminodeoxychorismate synthase component I [Curtobacterium sp. MCBD17_029]PYY57588.1 aminodeoxychorismate synthase component I [Curtobacterium sp. MCPF17_015]PYY58245.1 aminodeoxychorismate synthase component I [Curtobacterium sp. MCJR17_055]
MDDLRGLTAEAVPTPSVEGGAGPRLETRRLDGPVDLAVLARRTTTDLVWFDSALPEGAPPSAGLRAAWSVLALTDGPFAARFRHQDRVARLDVSPAAGSWFGSSRVEDRAAFAVLDDLLQRTPTLDAPVDGCAFALGWVGFLGYELGREVDGPDRTADGHADADLRFVDRAVLVRGDGAAWALTLVDDDEPDASAANRAWSAGLCGADPDDRGLAAPEPHDDLADRATGLPDGGREPDRSLLEACGRVDRAAYERAVDTCRDEIREGNAFQVCLTTAFAVPDVPDAPDAPDALDRPGAAGDRHLAEYLRIRRSDPVPFGAYLRTGDLRIASRSPERFLRIDADGGVLAEPIKGTRPRHVDPVEDAVVRADLSTSAKDRAENVMIVDLLRNDLQRTARPGSVRVERLCDVETYASVHQMVSTIAGVLAPGASRAAVVRAAFPPGSMTGAPKRSATAIADRLEGAPRGVYAGAIGYFSASGAVDLSVAIRTLVTVLHPDGSVRRRTLGAGGAVTWSSSPEDEADEVEAKTVSVLRGVGAAAHW